MRYRNVGFPALIALVLLLGGCASGSDSVAPASPSAAPSTAPSLEPTPTSSSIAPSLGPTPSSSDPECQLEPVETNLDFVRYVPPKATVRAEFDIPRDWEVKLSSLFDQDRDRQWLARAIRGDACPHRYTHTHPPAMSLAIEVADQSTSRNMPGRGFHDAATFVDFVAAPGSTPDTVGIAGLEGFKFDRDSRATYLTGELLKFIESTIVFDSGEDFYIISVAIPVPIADNGQAILERFMTSFTIVE